MSFKAISGAGEVAQQLRILAALAADWRSVPSTQVGWLTTAHTVAPDLMPFWTQHIPGVDTLIHADR